MLFVDLLWNPFYWMSKRPKKQLHARPSVVADRRSELLIFAAVILGLFLVGLATLKFFGQRSDTPSYVPRLPGTITYSKEIAPIIYEHCLTCHRPGESAHLELVSYSDAK